MKKILLIVEREYKTRIRKKSFLIMTLLGPLVMTAMLVFPTWMTMDKTKELSILINDESGRYLNRFESVDYIQFQATSMPERHFQLLTENDTYDAFINIPENPYKNEIVVNYHSGVRELEQQFIEGRINRAVMNLPALKVTFSEIKSSGAESNTLKMFLGLGAAVMIYFFIFLYGIQVMKGVIEEKNNRIIEVMISSVSPFQLMIGKIFGLALLALTQFGIWLIVIVGCYSFLYSTFGLENYLNPAAIERVTEAGTMSMKNAVEIHDFVTSMESVNFTLFLISFTFYFLMGYLIYGALFAIVGAASDVDTETQQFIMPITVPLLGTMMFILQMFNEPHSNLAQTLSQIPLTSPLAMMARIPYADTQNNFYLELLLSTVLSILGFMLITFVAARIYRIGILSYGAKVSYRDLGKWFFMKD